MMQALSRREYHNNAAGSLLQKFASRTDFIGDFMCLRADKHLIEGQDPGDSATPLACSFSKVHPNLVAVADEDGGILILDSFRIDIDAVKQDWRAHKNAIFDIDWTPGENKLLTASGDQSIQNLDVEAEQVLSTFKGHSASVRTVRCSDNPYTFATGARDGHVMIWDNRINAKGGFLPPVNTICNAHGVPLQIGSAKKKRTPKAQQKSSQHTVTAVVFQDDHTLITSGCVDGSLKLWDLRKTYSNLKSEPIPAHRFVYNGSGTRTHGFSSLLLDASRTRLFANCMDNTVYMYDCAGLSKDPVAHYKGHTNSSFYVKMSLSPDDLYLLSGSSNGQGYIWKVNEPRKPPLVLNCHIEEISGVAWSPIDHSTLMTLSDDCSICTWRAVRPDHLDVWKSKAHPSMSHVVGTSEWMPEVKDSTSVATPQRSGLLMWSTPERPTTPSLTTRTSTRSPLVVGVTRLAESPDTREAAQGTSKQQKPSRPDLLSPVKSFGGLNSPLKSPKHIHVLLSPRKTPLPGCFDALSPRKTPSAKRNVGSASVASRSVKRKLCEISNPGNHTDGLPDKQVCRGLVSEASSETPLKTPSRMLIPSENITPNRTCVQNLRFGATPDKIKQSPTVNLPNYVLNPEPRTPQPVQKSDSLKENWLLQLSKQKKEHKEKTAQNEDGGPESTTPKPGVKKGSAIKCLTGTENVQKATANTVTTPKSLRKARTPKSGAKPRGTPKSAAKTQTTSKLAKVEDAEENVQTPKSSQGSSVKRRGTSLRLSKTKTPTATRRSILSYFSPKDQGKQ